MGRSSNKDVQVILGLLEEQGWRITRATRHSKYLAWPPDGESRPIPIHETPSDYRWQRNLVAQLRQSGAEL